MKRRKSQSVTVSERRLRARVVRAAMRWYDKRCAYMDTKSVYPMPLLKSMDGAMLNLFRSCIILAVHRKGKR